jgi:hypothetical protein
MRMELNFCHFPDDVFNPEVGGSIVLQNIHILPPQYTVQQSRKLNSKWHLVCNTERVNLAPQSFYTSLMMR